METFCEIIKKIQDYYDHYFKQINNKDEDDALSSSESKRLDIDMLGYKSKFMRKCDVCFSDRYPKNIGHSRLNVEGDPKKNKSITHCIDNDDCVKMASNKIGI
jgi:hypothetical protein